MHNFVPMKKVVVNREAVRVAVAKMVADKAAVRSFMQGKISIAALEKKGITLAKPI